MFSLLLLPGFSRRRRLLDCCMEAGTFLFQRHLRCAKLRVCLMFVPRAAALGADWVAAIGVRWEVSGEETRALLLMLLWRGLAIVRRVFGYFGRWVYGGVRA